MEPEPHSSLGQTIHTAPYFLSTPLSPANDVETTESHQGLSEATVVAAEQKMQEMRAQLLPLVLTKSISPCTAPRDRKAHAQTYTVPHTGRARAAGVERKRAQHSSCRRSWRWSSRALPCEGAGSHATTRQLTEVSWKSLHEADGKFRMPINPLESAELRSHTEAKRGLPRAGTRAPSFC